MIKSGVRLSTGIYNIILSGLCKNGCAMEAIMFFEKLRTIHLKFDIRTLNIIIDAMFNVGRIEQAKNLFAAIPANGLKPNVITYTIMMSNLIEAGLVEEADNTFSSMETSGCASNSHMLNIIIRKLFKKGEILRAVSYMSRLDGKNMSLEASTISLLISLFSKEGIYSKHKDLLPAKYQFFEGDIISVLKPSKVTPAMRPSCWYKKMQAAGSRKLVPYSLFSFFNVLKLRNVNYRWISMNINFLFIVFCVRRMRTTTDSGAWW
jgi:pentatricopeptide repeat protein